MILVVRATVARLLAFLSQSEAQPAQMLYEA